MSRLPKEVRRSEIIQAAFAVVNSRGLPLPSYDQIAEQAGISRQLIRHYFPDMEKLMEGVCDYLASSYRECLAAGIIASGNSDRLPLFLDFYFDFLAGKGLAKPRDDAAYDAMFALAAAYPSVRTNLREQYSLLQNVIAHEIQIDHPKLAQRACHELGFLFVALVYGHWKMVASLGISEDYNAVTRAAVDRLVQSYLSHYEDPDTLPMQ